MELFPPTWNFSRFWASSTQTANDYFIGLLIKWRVLPQLVRAIRGADKTAEDPLMLKQKVGMMLREQLWSVSPGALCRGVCGCSGSAVWARELNFCSIIAPSGQPEPRQNNVLSAQSGCVQPHSLSQEQGQQKGLVLLMGLGHSVWGQM